MKTEELLVVVALIAAIFSYYIIQCKHEVALLTESVVSLMNDGWSQNHPWAEVPSKPQKDNRLNIA